MASMAAATTTTTTKKKNSSSSSFFFLKCGCTDAKSISVSTSGRPDSADRPTTSLSGRHNFHALSSRPETSSADTTTLTATTATTTSTSHRDGDEEEGGSPSFSGLLRQLNELEQRVAAWDCRHRRLSSDWAAQAGEAGETDEAGEEEKTRRSTKPRSCSNNNNNSGRKSHQQRRRRHRRSHSDGGGGQVVDKVGESVAVVRQSEDPLGDFRRSMLQMIVEKELVGGEELRQLLRRFLALNTPRHHPIIIRAFADIWRDVFSPGYSDDYSLHLLHRQPRLRRNSYHGGHPCY